MVQDADGVIWKLATSAKKDKGPATRKIDDLVLLIGAADLGASKRFYVERGLSVKRSFPGRYVEFDAPAGGIKLALYPGRAGLAKDAGVSTGRRRAARHRGDTAPQASSATLTGSAGRQPRCRSSPRSYPERGPRRTPRGAAHVRG